MGHYDTTLECFKPLNEQALKFGAKLATHVCAISSVFHLDGDKRWPEDTESASTAGNRTFSARVVFLLAGARAIPVFQEGAVFASGRRPPIGD